MKALHGRKIAVDASMAIYQFLIAVRSGGPNQQAMMLTNADGETTSHIQGMFNRTIRFLTEGLKPAFVFDGKAPTMKSGELFKRQEKRKKAEEELKKASDEGNVEEMDKQSKRLARAGRKENEDCQKLLRLMGGEYKTYCPAVVLMDCVPKLVCWCFVVVMVVVISHFSHYSVSSCRVVSFATGGSHNIPNIVAYHDPAIINFMLDIDVSPRHYGPL